MVKALILDYNGVVVNDEPLHHAAWERVLDRAGIALPKETYDARYVGLPDRDIARDLLKRRDGAAGDDAVDHLLSLKALAYRDLTRRDLPEVPGARDLILRASERWPVAVASGAIRVEVEDGLERLGVRHAVSALVTIESVTRGKPDPETFLTARAALIRVAGAPGARHGLDPSEPCASFLVVEDAPAGLAAARAAWMPAVGVATSFPEEHLKPAALVVADLTELTIEAIASI